MKKVQKNYPMEEQEISLEEESVIEHYSGLEFSDQEINDSLSSDAENGDLSADQLQYLGVHRFPGNYKYSGNFGYSERDNESETKEQTYYMQDSNAEMEKGRNKKIKSYSGIIYEEEDNEDKSQENSLRGNKKRNNFHIDSFLNSQPTNPRNQALKNRKVQMKDAQEKQSKRNSNRNRNHKQAHISSYFSNSHQQDDDMTLITIPQIHSNQHKLYQNNRKKKSWYSLQQQQRIKDQLFSVRFEQAKLNFMDAFLPPGMKIGNNAYAFYKYTQSKGRNGPFEKRII